jgi:phosphoglycerate dehydrogenase-like enzyme
VNLSQAKGMGIQVRNIAHYGDASVAEHAIALMLECSRRIGRMDASMKRGEWDTLECIDLHGKTLGLVGFGGISQAVARIAAAIGMRVQVWARPSHVEAVEESGYVFEPDLMSLFAHSDVVSLHVGLNDATAGMITREHLDALRTGSFFINTARSQLVTHGALEQRLERGDIVAGVDVYDQEPLPADDPLRGYDNAILTPHAAWFADTAFANIARQVFADVRDYFQGGTLGLVN